MTTVNVGLGAFEAEARYGRVRVGDSAALSFSERVLINVDSFVPSGTQYLTHLQTVVAPNNGGTITVGMQVDASVAPTVDSATSDSYGLSLQAQQIAGDFALRNLIGLQSNAVKNIAAGTHSLNQMTSYRAVNRPTAGVIANMYGVDVVQGAGSDAGVLTTAVGVYVHNGVFGSATTQIGINLEALSGATTNIAIRALGGHSRHVGAINVGLDSTPTNNTNGDLTAKRILAGDDTAFTGAARWMLNVASFVPAALHTSAVITTVYAPAGLGSTAAGIEVDAHVQNTAADAGEYWGGVFTAYHDGGSTFALTGSPGLVGLEGTVVIVSGATGNVTEADGVRASIRPRSTATITWASAFRAIPAGSGAGDTTGTLTNSAGLYVQNRVTGVAVGTQHGIYIEALTGGSTDNIAIRTLGGTHRFVGGVNIGTDAAPDGNHFLDVHGSVLLDNNKTLDWRDSGATPRVGMYMGSDDESNFSVMGGAGKHFRILNQALNAALWQITNAGVQDVAQIYSNGTLLTWLDSGATQRSVLQMATDNFINLFVAGGAGKKVRVLNQAGNAELWGVDNSGNVNAVGTRIATPSTQQSIAVSAAIVANAEVVQISTTTAANLTATPTIADGTDGQMLLVVNTGTNAFTLQDQGTLAGSNLRLTATGITLGTRDSIKLMYSAAIGDWIQVAPSTNVL